MDAYGEIVKRILQRKKPKVLCFYQNKQSKYVYIDSIALKPVCNRKMQIIRFRTATWDKNSSTKLALKELESGAREL